MTEQEKKVLLQDLCARLPYGVRIREYNDEYRWHDGVLSTITNDYFSKGEPSIEGDWINRVEDVKPYLRPMSSMTEEEYEGFCKTDKLMATLLEINKLGIQGTRECHLMVAKALGERVTEQQNWLNSHHFDYRGLIEKGLALEAPDNMYN